MANSYKLYGRPGSGSLAVQVALEEIGAAYERIWVGREPAAVEAFRAVNPAGRVPALVLPDGTVMFESAAMLMHLASQPQSRLAPRVGAGLAPDVPDVDGVPVRQCVRGGAAHLLLCPLFERRRGGRGGHTPAGYDRLHRPFAPHRLEAVALCDGKA